MWNECVFGDLADILCLGSHTISQKTLDPHPFFTGDHVKMGIVWLLTEKKSQNVQEFLLFVTIFIH